MKSVLLVEDDRKISFAIGLRLKSMGYEVHTAMDAASAMMQATKVTPDVALIDINLPAGDGFMVAERLQNLVKTALTPIIFITASKKDGLREKAKKLGAVAFLEKPCEPTALADAIEMAF